MNVAETEQRRTWLLAACGAGALPRAHARTALCQDGGGGGGGDGGAVTVG